MKQHQPRIIRITKCLNEQNCPLRYTDIFESVLIECRDPKHKTGIQKVEEEEGKVTRPANSNPQPTTQARSPLGELNGFKK